MITYAFDYIWFKVNTDTRWQRMFKWSATTLVIIAAYLFTVYPELGYAPWLLGLFLTGHIIWVTFAYIMREWALFCLNLAFVPIDAYGVLIRL